MGWQSGGSTMIMVESELFFHRAAVSALLLVNRFGLGGYSSRLVHRRHRQASTPLRFFLLKRCGFWALSCYFTPPPPFYLSSPPPPPIIEILKWVTPMPILMQNHSGGDNVLV